MAERTAKIVGEPDSLLGYSVLLLEDGVIVHTKTTGGRHEAEWLRNAWLNGTMQQLNEG